ncbi:conserved hypothetical protein [Ricinus communis]|uniref:S-protein homolog n=1 Tax=Ricinus communis TaxID=3988 RepID=B9RWP2_RICCO|nr:conserved hypothetical protein [Ricinus communis]
MYPSIRNVYLLALFLLLIPTCCNAWFFPKKRTVKVTNGIGPGLDLTVHCKSKDDDLGTKVLPYNGYFSFRFHPNFMDTTLYFCSMSWHGQSHKFDIYTEDRDKNKCPHDYCGWLVRPSGPSMNEARFKLKRATVIITNDLNQGLDLSVHCKSKEDDLGVHILPPHNNYQFEFQPNFWGVTQFFCGFTWKKTGIHWFDIYIQNRDYPKCSTCKWVLRQKGPCMFEEKTNNYTLCYDWNK